MGFRVLPAIAAVVGLAACGPKTQPAPSDSASVAASAATDPGIVRQAIDAANAKAIDAMNRGDTTVALSNYADDAVMMMPGQAPMNGRAAISRGIGGVLSQYTLSNVKVTTSDVMVGGDLAVETGIYEMTLTPKAGGKPINDKGKYVTVWKRQADGSWKVVRDINNSDIPPTG